MPDVLTADGAVLTVPIQDSPTDESRTAGTRPFRILCAEDDSAVGPILVHLLQSRSYAAELAVNGQRAATRLAANVVQFDLLITDHAMPVMSGLELVRTAREHGFSGRIAVYCGGLQPLDRKRYEAFGIDAFIEKLDGPDVLLAVVAGVARAVSKARR